MPETFENLPHSGAHTPGCVDAHCAERRVWEDGQKNAKGRPRILLPANDRPDSVVAEELAGILAPKNEWFLKSDAVVSVELNQLSEKIRALVFRTLQPIEARSVSPARHTRAEFQSRGTWPGRCPAVRGDTNC